MKGGTELSQEAGPVQNHPDSFQKRAWTCGHQEVTCRIFYGVFCSQPFQLPLNREAVDQGASSEKEVKEAGQREVAKIGYCVPQEGSNSHSLPAESGEAIHRAATCI